MVCALVAPPFGPLPCSMAFIGAGDSSRSSGCSTSTGSLARSWRCWAWLCSSASWYAQSGRAEVQGARLERRAAAGRSSHWETSKGSSPPLLDRRGAGMSYGDGTSWSSRWLRAYLDTGCGSSTSRLSSRSGELRSEGCVAASARGTRGNGQCPPSARVAVASPERAGVGQGFPSVSTEGRRPPGASTQPTLPWRANSAQPSARLLEGAGMGGLNV